MAARPSLLTMAATAAAGGVAFVTLAPGAPRAPASHVEQLSLRGAGPSASTPSHLGSSPVVVGSVGVMAAAAVLGGKAAGRRNCKKAKTGLQAAVDLSTELGACPPVGFWDPLQLSEFDDPKIMTATFRRRRAVELQHGRVCMIATIGYIVPEFIRWPGYLSPSNKLAFADVPNGLAAWNSVPSVGWWQMISFVGLVEVTNLAGQGGKEYPGDYDGYGAFGIPRGKGIEDKEKKKKSLLAEINNGRLAMMSIMGMLFQDGLTGQAWGDWSLYTGSPLR